jgi:hypothetical protein
VFCPKGIFGQKNEHPTKPKIIFGESFEGFGELFQKFPKKKRKESADGKADRH